MAKSRSRSPKSRTSRAKGAKKGAKKSAVRRKKTPGTTAVRRLQEPVPDGINIKKLRADIDGAIAKLQKRIDDGDPAKRLPETRDAFMRWSRDIDATICLAADGPCGNDMFIGS